MAYKQDYWGSEDPSLEKDLEGTRVTSWLNPAKIALWEQSLGQPFCTCCEHHNVLCDHQPCLLSANMGTITKGHMLRLLLRTMLLEMRNNCSQQVLK